MKNFTQELKDILKEDAGRPILSPDEVRGRANTMVILTNQAPPKLLALGGSSRKAILVNYEPLMITFPNQKGVYKVQADDIVFENHHTGRDVTEAGAEETSYEKFFASAMKKFGVSSPIELSPDDTKKFFNYVDKNWDAEEESDGSKNEILPALAAVGAGLAGAGMAAGGLAQGIGSAVGGIAKGVGSAIGGADTEDSNEIAPALAAVAGAAGAGAAGKVMDRISGDENESGWEDPPKLGGEPSLITPVEGDDNEDVSTGKVGKKDKGSYQHAYKLALKKYQIHSADELDTPAERKGFTAYVDKLWKGGEVKDHALESDMTEAPKKSRAQRDREKIKKQKQRQRKQKQQKREREDAAKKRQSDQAAQSREREQAQKDRQKNQSQDKPKPVQDMPEPKPAQDKPEPKPAPKPEPKPAPKPEPKPDKDKEKDKEKKMAGLGSFLKQAGGQAKKAAQQQAAQYKS